MQPVKDTLPEIKGRTSRPLLFVVEGKRYAGYYHKDGWFYCQEHGHPALVSAFGPNVDTSSVPDAKAVTEWEYLRGEDRLPLEEFTKIIKQEAAQRTAYFTVGNVVPDHCASLDILTPMHQGRFNQLSEGERILLYSIIEFLANYRVGSLLNGSSIPLNARQSTRGQVSAVLTSLRKKRVLEKLGAEYRILNPGFELWMRMRSLQMKGYYPFGGAICPVLLRDDKMPADEFWQQLCLEANVTLEMLPVYRYAPSVLDQA